jgi:tetratricopeptide (TPR) repeat protein
VAKNGRAEVLKAQGDLPGALLAYREVRVIFPSDLVSRNGLANVLAVMHRFDEALALIPETRQSTLQDWIAFHLRGMILLRRGKVDEAERTFSKGVADCPFAAERDYFRSGLSLVRIRSGMLEKAQELLTPITAPTLAAVKNLLQIHISGEQGEFEEAQRAYDNLIIGPWKNLDPLGELKDRYIVRTGARHSNGWLEDKEVDFYFKAA